MIRASLRNLTFIRAKAAQAIGIDPLALATSDWLDGAITREAERAFLEDTELDLVDVYVTPYQEVAIKVHVPVPRKVCAEDLGL